MMSVMYTLTKKKRNGGLDKKVEILFFVCVKIGGGALCGSFFSSELFLFLEVPGREWALIHFSWHPGKSKSVVLREIQDDGFSDSESDVVIQNLQSRGSYATISQSVDSIRSGYVSFEERLMGMNPIPKS